MKKLSNTWNEGTSQALRKSQDLTNPNFEIDERGFDTLVKEIVDHSKYVAFHDAESIISGHVSKNWEPLLESNEVVILAQLKHLPFKEIEDEFYKHFNLVRSSEDSRESVRHLFGAILQINRLSKKFLHWLDLLSKLDVNSPQRGIYTEWEMAFGHLVKIQLRNGEETAEAERKPDDDKKESDKKGKKLEKGIPILDAMLAAVRWENSGEKGANFPFKKIDDVQELFRALVNIVHFLRSKDANFTSLSRDHQTHEPHMGLIFSFVELFKKPQQKLNGFHHRHLDLYYRDLLGLLPAKAKGDSTFLKFKLEEALEAYVLRKGTPFIAGTDDDGDSILYKTTENLLLDHCHLQEVKGLQVGRDENAIDPEKSPVMTILSRNNALENSKEPWPIMNMMAGDLSQISPAEIGFAISSENFELNEGARNITLEFDGKLSFHSLNKSILDELSGDSGDPSIGEILAECNLQKGALVSLAGFFNKYFKSSINQGKVSVSTDFINLLLDSPSLASQNIGGPADAFPTDMKFSELIKKLEEELNASSTESLESSLKAMLSARTANIKDSGKDFFFRKFRRLFIEAFQIGYSSSECWVEIDPVSVELPESTSSSYKLRITLQLSSNDPALVPNSELGFEMPTVKFTLNDKAPQYPYDFLSKIHPYKISCQIRVQGVKDLVLYNQIGQINPDSPFNPFGPTPNNYSYLLIGNKEIFRKKIDTAGVNMEWMDLPSVRGGFTSHYASYDEEYNNSDFEADVSILSGGKWLPEKGDRQELKLFECEEHLKDSMRYDLDISSLDFNADFGWNPEDLAFDKKSSRGFLKLQLKSPKTSFGHDEYPSLLSKTVLESAKKSTGLVASITGRKTSIHLPNLPYTPKVGRLSMDYEVSFEIDFRSNTQSGKGAENKFYHVLPFEGSEIIQGNGEQAFLIPRFSNEGELYLGFNKMDTQVSLSLLFHLLEQEVEQDTGSEQQIRWSYLENNQWIFLKPHQIPTDSTFGLIHSGIVRLDLPKINTDGNTILSNNLIWIRASCAHGVNVLGKVISISNHGVEVDYFPNGNGKSGNHRIEPESITEPEQDIPELSSMVQPMESFGGTLDESDDHFKIRMSERLRHKGRSVVMYDYERMILEEFPTLNKVLCINAHEWQTDQPAPGRVLLVLVPKLINMDYDQTRPSCSVFILRSVSKFLASRCSRFVTIDVINPVYERVRVFASVVIVNGEPAGLSLKTLNKEVREFISPWIADASLEPSFHRVITREEMESFIQSRPYVQFVTRLSLVKTHQEERTEIVRPHRLVDTGLDKVQQVEPRPKNRVKSVEGKYPWSILTTASNHSFELLEMEATMQPDEAGLDELFIEEDFVIPLKKGSHE